MTDTATLATKIPVPEVVRGIASAIGYGVSSKKNIVAAGTIAAMAHAGSIGVEPRCIFALGALSVAMIGLRDALAAFRAAPK